MDLVDARYPQLAASYGCLVALGERGRAERRGTVGFVRLDGRHFLLTAHHVAAAHDQSESLFFHFDLDEQGVAVRDSPTEGRRIIFRPVIACASAALDVAFIEATDEIMGLPGLRWFDLAEQPGQAEHLRASWREAVARQAAVPLVMLGFGNWTFVENEAERWQLFSATPLLCNLTAWDDSTLARRAPQMWLDISATPNPDTEVVCSAQEVMFAERLGAWDDSDRDSSALGGYSGGPILWLTGYGEILVGTVKNGTKWGDAARVAATPISASAEILRGYLQSK